MTEYVPGTRFTCFCHKRLASLGSRPLAVVSSIRACFVPSAVRAFTDKLKAEKQKQKQKNKQMKYIQFLCWRFFRQFRSAAGVKLKENRSCKASRLASLHCAVHTHSVARTCRDGMEATCVHRSAQTTGKNKLSTHQENSSFTRSVLPCIGVAIPKKQKQHYGS